MNIDDITEEMARQYCESIGARVVWQMWLNNMRAQGRDVKPEYTFWETLPERDKQLDYNIAFELLDDFIAWLRDRGEA